jgi:hypothetical protein
MLAFFNRVERLSGQNPLTKPTDPSASISEAKIIVIYGAVNGRKAVSIIEWERSLIHGIAIR